MIKDITNIKSINNINTGKNESIKKIERRMKHLHRYSGKIRERNMCPNCHSLDIAKRTTTRDFKCYNCKWIGKDIKTILA